MSGVLRDVTQEHAAREATQRMEDNAAELARLEGTAAVAGGVAHTFSNLLGGVLGAVSSLEEQAQQDPSLVEGLSLIRDASEHAGRLTKQLRGLSGHGRFRMDIADLPTCVHEMQDLLNTAVAEQAQVEIEHIGPPSSVKVDTDQLQQVAVNLVLNAAESDPRPTPRVVVRTRSIHIRPGESLDGLASPQGLAPGRYALVEVIDEGCGMTQAVRQRMFEPFFSTRVGRAGLGLSAVLGIIRGHGGHVAVHSKPGLGTTITLVLPENTQAPPVANPPSPPPMVSDTPDRPPRVLVADDEPVIRRLVERVLVRCRYSVECVSDGQQAVDVLAQRREDIDLLLVDLTMPGMSGHEVLALTRRKWPDLPVIVMSGYTQREVSGPLAAASTVGFIEKPFTAAQLRERINGLLPVRAADG
jgi:nitrogen-specific signal transduction histidine kinase